MKKTHTVRLTAVLLAFLLFANLAIPVCASDRVPTEPTIESVTPRGEPWLALELTPTGYIFTDYYIPREYDVTFKDGTTTTARLPRENDLDPFFDGYYLGSVFDVDEDNELYVFIEFDQKTKQSTFEIGQVILEPREYEGRTVDFRVAHLISIEPCRTEIDDSSWIARLLYPIYSASQRIITFFAELRYKLSR